jgi:tetratricopeptide (TPR) repeat protein
MHYAMADSNKARDYYTKSLAMTRKCIPSSQHYNIPSILQDIALTYDYNSQEALNYRLEALDIQSNAEPVHYPSLGRLLDDIALTYKSMGKMEDSLKFYEKALQIRETYLYNDKFSLARTLNGLASVYEEMGEMTRALNSYHKIMRMCTQHYHSYHRLCEKTRRNIKRIKRML